MVIGGLGLRIKAPVFAHRTLLTSPCLFYAGKTVPGDAGTSLGAHSRPCEQALARRTCQSRTETESDRAMLRASDWRMTVPAAAVPMLRMAKVIATGAHSLGKAGR
jgi:hypothetical protein